MYGSPEAREHMKLPRARGKSEGISGQAMCWGKAVLGLGSYVERVGVGFEMMGIREEH